MKKEEIKAKMAELDAKMKEIGENSIDTAKIIGLEAKDKIDNAVKETKGNVNAAKENFKIFSERVKGKASSELIKAQMNIDAAKADLAAKKEAFDKVKMEEYIEDTVEYAAACIELSILAAEEAQLAILEAAAAQQEYEEKYGEEEEEEEEKEEN